MDLFLISIDNESIIKQFASISICLVKWIDFEDVGFYDANVSYKDKHNLGKQMGLINKLKLSRSDDRFKVRCMATKN